MKPNEQDEDSAVRKSLDELTALRDGLRVRAHLMSMEARDHWEAAEKHLVELEQRVAREGEKATVALIAKTRELSAHFKDLLNRKH